MTTVNAVEFKKIKRTMGRKRTAAKRLHDLTIAAEMYARGKTQYEIAERLGITQQQVSVDIKEIHKQWEKERLASYSDLQNKELAKIDLAEREAWEAWHRSCEDEEEQTAKQIGGRFARNETSIRKKKKAGDPRFLELALRCVDRRCEILGLNAPIRQTFVGVIGSGGMNMEVLGSTERAKQLADILHECGAAQLLAAKNPVTPADVVDAVAVEVVRD